MVDEALRVGSQQPRVSVVIPTHNRKAFLADAVESCLAQSYPNVEVLVVDDGSTDGTGQWLRQKAELVDDGRFRYLLQENRGACVARNAGLEASSGRYVKFLDSDDTLDADAIAHAVAALERTGADLCIGGRRYMSRDGRKSGVHYRPPAGWIDDPLIKFFDVVLRPTTGLWTFRRSVFDNGLRWDPQLVARQDVDVLARVLAAGATVAGVPEAITNQRCHPGVRQRSREFEPTGFQTIHRANCRLYDLMAEQGCLEKAGGAFAASMCRTVLRWWDRDREAAKRCYVLAKKAHPRPRLTLSENYSTTTRGVASVLWAIGGPYLCAPMLRLYGRTSKFRWRWRRRLERWKSACRLATSEQA